jgi:hypothetical protein
LSFKKKKKIRIEPTVMSDSIADERDGFSGRSLSDSMIRSSSLNSPEEVDEELSQRFGYMNILAFHSALRKRIQFITLKATTVVTVTTTSTYYLTISTKTFFVQVCTPTPFPYNVCSRKIR